MPQPVDKEITINVYLIQKVFIYVHVGRFSEHLDVHSQQCYTVSFGALTFNYNWKLEVISHLSL